VLTERALPVVIFAVDVVRYCSADRDEQSARRYRQKPPPRNAKRHYFGEQYTCFAAQDAIAHVKRNEMIEAPAVEKNPAIVQTDITVAATVAEWQSRSFASVREW
jgi:hypothetical protein